MNKFTSYCLTQPQSGSDSQNLRTSAVKKDGYYVLNGEKAFITGGEASDIYFVICKNGQGSLSLIAVEKDTPGLSCGKPQKKLGWNSHPTQSIKFEDCKVPESNMIGQPGDGFKIAMTALDGGRLNIASCSLGGAWFAIQKAINYMAEREAFGEKLYKFQYLRFKMAEVMTKLTASRILVRHACQMLDQNSANKTGLSAMSKFFTTDACFEAANLALQIHGGYGVIRSYGLEQVVRDLRIMQIVEGTNEIMRLVIAREVFKSL